MNSAEVAELVSDCPYLYHMAMKGSWPLIQQIGLVPTGVLLDHFEVPADQRIDLTTKRRPRTVKISHSVFGSAFIRDQIPLLDDDLAACLTGGLSPSDWHKKLNERVFFWLTEQRLRRMLCAGAYKGDEHLVLKIPTRGVIDDYWERIELSPMNSGATRPWRHPRGPETFLPIDHYPYAKWRKARAKGERVVELTVIGGVPDIAERVEQVRVMSCSGAGPVLYQRAVAA